MSNKNTKKDKQKTQNKPIVKGLDLVRAVTLKTMYDQDSIMVADGLGSEYRIKTSEILKCLRVFEFSATESKKYTYLEPVIQSLRNESIENEAFEKKNKEIELRFRNDDLIAFANRIGIKLSLELAEEVAQEIANGFGNRFHEFIIEKIKEFTETSNESECNESDSGDGDLDPRRKIAINVLSKFEEFLDNHDITIPSSDRTGEKGEARLFGSEYYELEDSITEIIGSGPSKTEQLKDILSIFDIIISKSVLNCPIMPSSSKELAQSIRETLKD